MIIREFKINDINNGLIDTYKEVWSIDEITEDTIKEWLENNNYMFVVENDGEIIGTCIVHLQKKLIRNGGVAALIEDVAIREKFRGNNIGSKLIEKAVEFAKSKNCYKIILSCFPNRVNFYEKNGFFNESILMRYKI